MTSTRWRWTIGPSRRPMPRCPSASSRWGHHGFRSSRRYIVFQVLPDTLGLGPEVWRVLSKAHDTRNRTEYEGAIDVDERLLSEAQSLSNCCGEGEATARTPKESK